MTRFALTRSLLLCGLLFVHASAFAQTPALVGTWKLVAADVIRPDGSRAEDYGPSPHGLAIFTDDGHYIVEIYRAVRPKFASGDKRRGTADDYRDASLGMSCHFGTYAVDAENGAITFHIDRGSFPNWDDTRQVRSFTLTGNELSWRVPARPDGSIPVSTFVRVR